MRSLVRKIKTVRVLWRIYRASSPLWEGKGRMSANLVLRILRIVYVDILRPLVFEKVQSSDPKWDDTLLLLLDRMFAPEEKPTQPTA